MTPSTVPRACDAFTARISVTDAVHVDFLRRIRNECRGSYVTDNSEISWPVQREWWHPATIHAFLYVNDELGVVGFGMLRYAHGRWWSSVGVLPDARGCGVGAAITHDLWQFATAGGLVVYGVALKSNPAGMALHSSRPEEWEKVQEDSASVTFRSKGLSP